MFYRFWMTGVIMLMLGCGAAAPAHADLGKNAWCKADRTPNIEIKTSTDKVFWDFTKSERDLNKFHIDTDNPYGNNVITDVGGLMQGGIETKESLRYRTLTHNRLNQICYWFDTITVTLHISPTIFIATEFPQNTCKHNAIKEHELKHITVDREIVNKYAALIGQGVKKEVDRQSLYGPYKTTQSKEVEAHMKNRIEAVLKYYTSMMADERKRRQQVVDSLNEYERVNRMCQ